MIKFQKYLKIAFVCFIVFKFRVLRSITINNCMHYNQPEQQHRMICTGTPSSCPSAVPFSGVIRLSPLFFAHRLHTRLQILLISTRTTKRGLTARRGTQYSFKWGEWMSTREHRTDTRTWTRRVKCASKMEMERNQKRQSSALKRHVPKRSFWSLWSVKMDDPLFFSRFS